MWNVSGTRSSPPKRVMLEGRFRKIDMLTQKYGGNTPSRNFLSNIGVDQYIGVETKEFGFPQIHTEVLLLPGGMQDIGALGRRRVCAGPGRGGVRRGAAAAAPHRTEQPRSSLDLVQMPRGMSCTCLRTASSSATITTIKQLPVQNTRPCTRKLYLAR